MVIKKIEERPFISGVILKSKKYPDNISLVGYFLGGGCCGISVRECFITKAQYVAHYDGAKNWDAIFAEIHRIYTKKINPK